MNQPIPSNISLKPIRNSWQSKKRKNYTEDNSQKGIPDRKHIHINNFNFTHLKRMNKDIDILRELSRKPFSKPKDSFDNQILPDNLSKTYKPKASVDYSPEGKLVMPCPSFLSGPPRNLIVAKAAEAPPLPKCSTKQKYCRPQSSVKTDNEYRSLSFRYVNIILY